MRRWRRGFSAEAFGRRAFPGRTPAGPRRAGAAAVPGDHRHRLVPPVPDPADDRAHGAAAPRRRAGGVEQRDAGLPGSAPRPAMPMPIGSARLRPRLQAGVHLALFALAALWLPIGLVGAVPPPDANPAFWAPWFLLRLDRAALLRRLGPGAADAALVCAGDQPRRTLPALRRLQPRQLRRPDRLSVARRAADGPQPAEPAVDLRLCACSSLLVAGLRADRAGRTRSRRAGKRRSAGADAAPDRSTGSRWRRSRRG